MGSLAAGSVNRTLSKTLIKLAPDTLELSEIPIVDLPLYSQDTTTTIRARVAP